MKFLVEGTNYSMPLRQHVEDSLDTRDLEVASTSAPIPANNKGYQLLLKMGWKGAGLGKDGSGRTDPIDTNALDAGLRLGLGKQELDAQYTAAENVNRKELEIEKELTETEEQRERRLQRAEAQTRIEAEVKEMHSTFYCEICDKQYTSSAQLQEHLSSYDHHHRKRLKEVKQMELTRTRAERERKEQKRMAKEMARLSRQIAAAGGGQQPPLPPSNAAPVAPPNAPPLPPDDGPSGWAQPVAPEHLSSAAHDSIKRSRWDVVPDAQHVAPVQQQPPLPFDDPVAPPLPPGPPPPGPPPPAAPAPDHSAWAAGSLNWQGQPRAGGNASDTDARPGRGSLKLSFGGQNGGGGGLRFGIGNGGAHVQGKSAASRPAASAAKPHKLASLFGNDSDNEGDNG